MITVNGTGGDIQSPHAYDPEFRGATCLDPRYTERGRQMKSTRRVITRKGKFKAEQPLDLETVRARGMYGY
jgi:hypothetical protein